MGTDVQSQVLGPLVFVNIEGLSRCQHTILGNFADRGITTISIGQLHDVSMARRDWSDLQRSATTLLTKRGLRPAPSLSLCVRLHALGIEAVDCLRRQSAAVLTFKSQLNELVHLLRVGVLDETTLGLCRVTLA